MKRLLVPVLIVLFAIAGGTAGFLIGGHFYDNPPAPAGVQAVDPGDVIPDVAISDTHGQQRRLSEWRGQLLVVNYWASWCPPCIEEMPLLDRYAKQHQASGLAIVGIAEDDPDAIRDFLSRTRVDYPILIATPASSSMHLGNFRNVLPFTVLIDANGRLLERHAGLVTESLLDGWRNTHLASTSTED